MNTVVSVWYAGHVALSLSATLLCSNHHYSHLTPANQLSPTTHPPLIETQSYQPRLINDYTARRVASSSTQNVQFHQQKDES